jgi:hypothetical protein
MRWSDIRVAAVAVFVLTFLIYRLSPVLTVYDSRYEMLFSQQLLWHQSFSLPAQAFPELAARTLPRPARTGIDIPYQLTEVGDRFYYIYPPGNTILPLPYVLLCNAFHLFAADKSGVFSEAGDMRMQKGLAALLMAGLAEMIFLTSRLLLPFWWSLLVTVAAALGTQMWSTASRAMWTHTWGIFILGFVLWQLVKAETKQDRLRPIVLATCLAWMYFIRPTFALSIVGIAFYIVFYHRAILLPFLITGGLWLAALVAFSQYHYGHALPPYYETYISGRDFSFSEGLAGTLMSPSRGLFVYVPVLAFVIYLLVRYAAKVRGRLALMAATIVVVHLVLVSRFIGWHGGHCYGPRLSTDIVPWFALLGMLAIDARLKWRASHPQRDSPRRLQLEGAVGAVLLVASITLNGIGAMSAGALAWNVLPVPIQQDWSRLWDWRHPPFLGKFPHSTTRLHQPGA